MNQPITIDIETLPDLDNEPAPFGFEPPVIPEGTSKTAANEMMRPYKAALKEHETSRQKWLKTSLSAIKGGRVLCIGIKVAGDEPICMWGGGSLEGEALILKQLEAALTKRTAIIERGKAVKPELIGHNIVGFDLYFLRLRAAKHGCSQLSELLYRSSKFKFDRLRVYDTMLIGGGLQWRPPGTVDDYADLFGVKRDNPIDGSQVYEYWASDRHDEIKQHVLDDVETEYAIYLGMKGVGWVDGYLRGIR